MGVWGSVPCPGRLTPGKDPVPIVREAGCIPGPVWTGEENLAPIGFLSPDRPGRSESLYRLSYPGLLRESLWDIFSRCPCSCMRDLSKSVLIEVRNITIVLEDRIIGNLKNTRQTLCFPNQHSLLS